MKNPTFTKKEKELIVSALLFTASVDVCIDLKKKQEKMLIKLARKFDVDKVNTSYLYSPSDSLILHDNPQITADIEKHFDIRKHN